MNASFAVYTPGVLLYAAERKRFHAHHPETVRRQEKIGIQVLQW
jgi:hypothetical protein